MNLPQDFCTQMEHFLGTEAVRFFKSYEEERAYGLRLNLLKMKPETVEKLPFSLSPVPWCPEGFYASYEEHPGRHPLHAAGAYYIQEPSAMSVVSLLAPSPGEIVCDLCAAPGGKSTQIAAGLLGEGLLVSNEIISSRARISAENLERFGTTNAVVTNEAPEKMAAHFPKFFDKILVDAPCSGEGMFRKDETAINEWSKEQVKKCAERQQMILECAEKMLKPGGTLVYSTCTFSEEENENMIRWFLEKYPDFTLENWQNFFPENTGIVSGKGITGSMRLFPHKLKGEGHFAARLKKEAGAEISKNPKEKWQKKNAKKKKKTESKLPSDYLLFVKNYFKNADSILSHTLSKKDIRYEYFGEELYLVPEHMNFFDGLKTVRAGLHLGTLKKNRFEPSHALAKAASPADVFQSVESDGNTAKAYLHGETISCDSSLKGWVLVCYDGFSLGWGKADHGTLKNHYPKGLRLTQAHEQNQH
ncbi:MAG: RsmB/NOP family class I SAM-dependent RNA methyltransferase [Lachnospiraceae bacterium]|nr:RsmB/NOP family class I SAM-dependent RNA methyltransferase [Lachnospiraceae bacterium]